MMPPLSTMCLTLMLMRMRRSPGDTARQPFPKDAAIVPPESPARAPAPMPAMRKSRAMIGKARSERVRLVAVARMKRMAMPRTIAKNRSARGHG
ncbi:MAG: hypothetical protein HC888_12170, partial [Candidatus Competibacteraceae bacterium]|nr:hypothetical protein [Candidatus Competibacteraceae bacterium]